jgi:hypothetical protein
MSQRTGKELLKKLTAEEACPQKLKIIDGELVIVGSEISLRDYLRKWQQATGVTDGSYVNVADNEALREVFSLAQMMKGWAS